MGKVGGHRTLILVIGALPARYNRTLRSHQQKRPKLPGALPDHHPKQPPAQRASCVPGMGVN